MRKLLVFVAAIVLSNAAFAQEKSSTPEYPTVASALDALRAKSGVKLSTQSGWTVIEDRSTLSVWSFVPEGHPAHPAVIHRKVVQDGNNIFVQMNVLCEAPKAACDAVVTDFEKLNGKVRDSLSR